MIYLDNAATTQIAPEVLDAMRPYLEEEYGNPGSLHPMGQTAARAIIHARQQVAELLDCDPHEIVFTSGGTEGNNSVFAGLRRYLLDEGRTHIIISAVEHDSVRRAAKALEKDGFTVSELGVDSNGRVLVDDLKRLITEDTGLISVMFVNNELGTTNPIKDIVKIIDDTPILLHVDCVQAAGCAPLSLRDVGCDYATVSSHKMHGPKGVGALYIKKNAPFEPLIYGGTEQEYGLRGGTPNVAGIVGFGKACEIADIGHDWLSVSNVKRYFYNKLAEDKVVAENITVNADSLNHVGKVLNLKVNGVDAQSLVLYLASLDVCISAGSACRSHELEPSRTLTAIGLTPDEARSSVRFSFSKYNTQEEIVEAAKLVATAIRDLKGV